MYVLTILLAFVILGQAIKIERLNVSLAEIETKLVVSETNTYQCKAQVKSQNDAITKLEMDYSKANAEYQKLLNQPPEVRFKTVYKEVPSIGVKSDECKDIKKLLDDIRNAGY
jgi:hypothetical protein